MRTVDESRRRWDFLFNRDASSTDLKEALRSKDRGNPCQEGLRSICWKDFLLYDDVDRSQWPRKIEDSRNAYSALRDHFLKYIEHPDDLPATADPLTADENSPWQDLRRDETLRAEIYQDVERCLQENPYFRENSTKTKLLDILFIFTKLNPDLGYRQGMHELLAPILWVVEEDAVEPPSDTQDTHNSEDPLMLQALDSGFIEHDSFSIFCAVMQTAKSFYEHGDMNPPSNQNDIPPIVVRSNHIHQDVLRAVDVELAEHLQTAEVLPQIFLTRWIRVLFGREFSFEETLSIWDLLFAEKLRLGLIDTICAAMLLRIRWQLLEADYSSALSLVLRYPSPDPHTAESFVQDGLYLEKTLTPEGGAYIISKYSGRQPVPIRRPRAIQPMAKAGTPNRARRGSIKQKSEGNSPIRPPGLVQHKGLETLFQDVTEGVQRRTETWGVAKVVRGAMVEARRNIQSIQSSSSSPIPSHAQSPVSGWASPPKPRFENAHELNKRLQALEARNKALSKMLGDALNELRILNNTDEAPTAESQEASNLALARMQFVQVYLEDSSMPIPPEDYSHTSGRTSNEVSQPANDTPREKKKEIKEADKTPQVLNTDSPTDTPTIQPPNNNESIPPPKSEPEPTSTTRQPSPHKPRPSLADSSLSWMLGEDRHRHSFVSSASAPPEQSRHVDSKGRRDTTLFGDNRNDDGRKKSIEEDGLILSSLGEEGKKAKWKG
ncbi:hypothetical protein FQN54_003599 [Arachnomyces sp. PD_36]|nr:hypothetical protein FQN54_003599 [Arachnomyces sp. PD_36]